MTKKTEKQKKTEKNQQRTPNAESQPVSCLNPSVQLNKVHLQTRSTESSHIQVPIKSSNSTKKNQHKSTLNANAKHSQKLDQNQTNRQKEFVARAIWQPFPRFVYLASV